MAYDPHAVDAYAHHLSAVNTSRQVVASEDVYNSKGVLIIGKGQPISKTAVERIVSFKLVKPIERSVEIDGALRRASGRGVAALAASRRRAPGVATTSTLRIEQARFTRRQRFG